MATSLGIPPKRVEPNLVLFNFLCYNLLKKQKIKDGNTCIYVLPSSFFFLNVSGEISPTPGLERALRYDGDIIKVSFQE